MRPEVGRKLINLITTLLFVKFKQNTSLVLIFLFGVITQSITMVKSGLIYNFGMGFWGANAHDALWHLALINQLAQGSFDFPTFAGAKIVNYHIGFDLFAALIHRLTFLPVTFIYFQLLPVVFAVSYGILTYFLARKLFNNKTAAIFSVFFAYFGGSFGWVVNLFRGESLGGESMFWSMQSSSFLVNPPFVFSVIVFLLGFIFYLNYQEKGKKRYLFSSALLFGILVQIKAYAGVIVIGALALTALTEVLFTLFKTKRIILPKTLAVFILSSFISAVVFLPLNWGSQSLLVYKPWWFIETMFSFTDRLNWQRMEALRQIYVWTNDSFKFTRWVMLGLVIFTVGNLGSRFLGFLWFINLSKKGFWQSQNIFTALATNLFILYFLLITLLAPMLYIQKGTNWNTIQFFYYFLAVFNFLAGWSLMRLTENKNLLMKILLVTFSVLVTIPTTITTLGSYLPWRAPAAISQKELEGLFFLDKQPAGIVLTYPHDPYWREKFTEPRPLYAYETTAYVSAFSGKVTFLEDEMNLEITVQDYKPRRKQIEEFFATNNKDWARGFLVQNKIRYIYLAKAQEMALNDQDIGTEKIFENEEVRIYWVSW